MKNNQTEVEDYGDTIVIENISDKLDPYDMLEYCENVEREGPQAYRFDGVYPETKSKFIRLLKKG